MSEIGLKELESRKRDKEENEMENQQSNGKKEIAKSLMR